MGEAETRPNLGDRAAQIPLHLTERRQVTVMNEMVSIEEIEIGERARTDLGDLTDLIKSIKDVGLIHPVVVTADRKLIAGGRRLEACRKLGMIRVPVSVAEHITDAAGLLTAERDENTCRKDMTPSELVAIGRALEELKKPEAEARQRASRAKPGQRVGGVPGNPTLQPETVAEIEAGRTDVLVSGALGIGRSSYWRAKSLVQAAETGDEKAAKAVEEMDRTGKITPAYNQWRDRPTAPGGRPEIQPAPVAPRIDSAGRRYPQRSPQRSLTEVVPALTGICAGLARLELDDSVTAEEAAQWMRDLSSEVLPVLRDLNKKLKEHSNATR
jgi:ParB family transcriptional regulator, chromosome partitioning protein